MITAALYTAAILAITGALIIAGTAVLGVIAATRWAMKEHPAARQDHGKLDDQPIPYWPGPDPEPDPIDDLASAIMCTSCRPSGQDPCTCTSGCGHLACTGGLSPEVAAYMRSLTMPGTAEGAEQ